MRRLLRSRKAEFTALGIALFIVSMIIFSTGTAQGVTIFTDPENGSSEQGQLFLFSIRIDVPPNQFVSEVELEVDGPGSDDFTVSLPLKAGEFDLTGEPGVLGKLAGSLELSGQNTGYGYGYGDFTSDGFGYGYGYGYGFRNGGSLVIKLGYLPPRDGDYKITARSKSGYDGEQAVAEKTINLTVSAPDIAEVHIDFRPRNFINQINPNSNGAIRVAIFGSSMIPTSEIDLDTVRLGPAGGSPTDHKPQFRDINRDGREDLILVFRSDELGVECGDNSITLTGSTFDGQKFKGIDRIRVLGCIFFPDEAQIDIEPGKKDNRINPNGKGKIEVAILGSKNFGVSLVDFDEVRFGPDGAPAEKTRYKHVDKDKFLDIVLTFRIEETGIECGDTSAMLTGEFFNGVKFKGIDDITTVKCEDDSDDGQPGGDDQER